MLPGMCLMLYIASDTPLPLLPPGKQNPMFSISPLPRHATAVTRQFAKPYIYLAGSHTGCGCGFEDDQDRAGVDLGIDAAEIAAGRESRRQLAMYLRGALAGRDSLEVFVCWAGDESKPTHRRVELTPEPLIEEHTWFLGDNFEPEFIRIVPGGATGQ
ncbi:MAG: hypothetical protein ACLFV7_02585 [Phycisphaerae bacterium]